MENEKLNQLQKMFEDGLITEEELKIKREKIITEMINQNSVSNTNQSLGTEKPKKQHKARKIILTCIAIFLGICFLCAIFDDEDDQQIPAEKTEITKSDDKNTKITSEQGDSQKSKSKTEKAKEKVNDITKYEALEIAEYVYGKENVVTSWGVNTKSSGYESFCLVKVSPSFFAVIFTQRFSDGMIYIYNPLSGAGMAEGGIVQEFSEDEAVKILTNEFKGDADKKTYGKMTVYHSNALSAGYTSLYKYNDRFFYHAEHFWSEIEEAHVKEKFDNFEKEREDFEIASKVKELGF